MQPVDQRRARNLAPRDAVLVVAAFAAALGLLSLLHRPAPPADPQALMCGRDLVIATPAARPGTPIRVSLVLTPGWVGVNGAQSEMMARRAIVAAGGAFRGLNLSFQVVGAEVTSYQPVPADPGTLLARVESAPVPDGADIVVAFMGPSDTGEDGAGDVGGLVAVVAAHPEDPERDGFVAAHEIAHLLGAHHGCDDGAPGGVMASDGFVNPNLLCPCTWLVMERNAARFSR